MIVSCPSCRTRFRHAQTGPAARVGRCSRCDETFELARPTRQYLLLPVATLGPQLRPAGNAAEVALPPAEDRAMPVGGAHVAARDRRRPGLLREWFGLLLLTALGAAAGFHLAVIADGDPLNATAAGTVGGLILGWSWIRAAERKR